MRFLHALTFASVALGAPNFASDLNPRGQSIVASISVSLKTADNSCSSQNNIVQKAVSAMKGKTDPKVISQAKSTCQAALKKVTTDLKTCTKSVVIVTTGAKGGITSAARAVAKKELKNLGIALKSANSAVGNVSKCLAAISNNLSSEVQKALQAEVAATKSVAKPFVDPLVALVSAVEKQLKLNPKDVDLLELKRILSSINSSLASILKNKPNPPTIPGGGNGGTSPMPPSTGNINDILKTLTADKIVSAIKNIGGEKLSSILKGLSNGANTPDISDILKTLSADKVISALKGLSSDKLESVINGIASKVSTGSFNDVLKTLSTDKIITGLKTLSSETLETIASGISKVVETPSIGDALKSLSSDKIIAALKGLSSDKLDSVVSGITKGINADNLSDALKSLTTEKIVTSLKSLGNEKLDPIIDSLTSGLNGNKLVHFFEGLSLDQLTNLFKGLSTERLTDLFSGLGSFQISGLLKSLPSSKLGEVLDGLSASDLKSAIGKLDQAAIADLLKGLSENELTSVLDSVLPKDTNCGNGCVKATGSILTPIFGGVKGI